MARVRKKRLAKYHEIRDFMVDTYPEVFTPRGELPKPLEIGVHAELQFVGHAIFGDDFKNFLPAWFKRHEYQLALLTNKHRFTLKGEQGSEITQDQRKAASEKWVAFHAEHLLKSISNLDDVNDQLRRFFEHLGHEVPLAPSSELTFKLHKMAEEKIYRAFKSFMRGRAPSRLISHSVLPAVLESDGQEKLIELARPQFGADAEELMQQWLDDPDYQLAIIVQPYCVCLDDRGRNPSKGAPITAAEKEAAAKNWTDFQVNTLLHHVEYTTTDHAEGLMVLSGELHKLRKTKGVPDQIWQDIWDQSVAVLDRSLKPRDEAEKDDSQPSSDPESETMDFL